MIYEDVLWPTCVLMHCAHAGFDCLCMLMHLWCLHTGLTDFLSCKYVCACACVSFFSTRRAHSGPVHVSGMYERENSEVFMMFLNVCVQARE